MATTPRQVVERFIEAMSDPEHADMMLRLKSFEKVVDHLANNESEVLAKPDDYQVRLMAAAKIRVVFDGFKKVGAQSLFWGLLKNYNMTSRDRKIVERASKTFAKSKMNRVKYDKAIEAYTKFLAEMRLFLSVAQTVLAYGKTHEEGSGTTVTAGPFTLVNTGGFSDKQMADVVKVVEKAAKELSKVGLSKICYGDIQVTNTIGRSSKILAFYRIDKDELYIRANLKGKQGPALHSVIHELGHRLHFKFLRGKDSEIRSMYDIIADRDRQALWDAMKDPGKLPKPGDTLQEGSRKTWVVDEVKTNFKGEQGVIVYLESKPEKKAVIKLQEWFKHKKDLAFVSPYAGKNHEENFAEMLANYVLGTLPDDQVNLLKIVL